VPGVFNPDRTEDLLFEAYSPTGLWPLAELSVVVRPGLARRLLIAFVRELVRDVASRDVIVVSSPRDPSAYCCVVGSTLGELRAFWGVHPL
jgi:hypothetical protein